MRDNRWWVIFIVVIAVAGLGWAGTSVRTGTLGVRVQQEYALRQMGSSIELKVRLNRGNAALLWAGNRCDQPVPSAKIISASGIYTFAPGDLGITAGDKVVCFVTADGAMRSTMLLNGTAH